MPTMLGRHISYVRANDPVFREATRHANRDWAHRLRLLEQLEVRRRMLVGNRQCCQTAHEAATRAAWSKLARVLERNFPLPPPAGSWIANSLDRNATILVYHGVRRQLGKLVRRCAVPGLWVLGNVKAR